MKHRSARKAKDVDFAKQLNSARRSARIDLTWRAEELADTDIWKQRTAESARKARRKPPT